MFHKGFMILTSSCLDPIHLRHPNYSDFRKSTQGLREMHFHFSREFQMENTIQNSRDFLYMQTYWNILILKQHLPLFLKIVKLKTQANHIFLHISETFQNTQ